MSRQTSGYCNNRYIIPSVLHAVRSLAGFMITHTRVCSGLLLLPSTVHNYKNAGTELYVVGSIHKEHSKLLQNISSFNSRFHPTIAAMTALPLAHADILQLFSRQPEV